MSEITPPPFPSPTKRWHTTSQPSTDPTRPELSAKGKSVLITGGGNTGIGGTTALSFAQAGASRICLLGRREAPLLATKALIEAQYSSVAVTTISTDITQQQAVNTAFATFTSDGSSKIDVLIHAAAIIGPKEPIATVNGEKFISAIQTNVTGSLWIAQAFLRYAAPNAVIVAINSWGAHLSINDAFSSYCVAKMAVFRLWDTVALANSGLCVFHTQPGVVMTEMSRSVGAAESFEGVKFDDGEFVGGRL